MKLCIISDLHCKYQHNIDTTSETLLFSNMPRKPFSQHPVAAMLKAVEEDEGIKSDVLLCLGDLGDKADEQGIITAWDAVEEIRQKIGSEIRLGIPGNHDVNSRKTDDKDAFTFIRNFHESFPTNDTALNAKFWTNGYCIVLFRNTLFLLINTVYDHADTAKANASNIRIQTIAEIEEEINSNSDFKNARNKVCILHHHPIKHTDIKNQRDSDSVNGGDKLMSLLNLLNFGLVIHGHKHQPRIEERNGLSILAAGSFSSFANLQGTGIQTMFHVIELSDARNEGTIFSWEYNVQEGWKRNQNRLFPPRIGFGRSIDISEVAKVISECVKRDAGPKLYSVILELFPNLDYVIPETLVKLGEVLKNDHKVYMRPEYPLRPEIVTLT